MDRTTDFYESVGQRSLVEVNVWPNFISRPQSFQRYICARGTPVSKQSISRHGPVAAARPIRGINPYVRFTSGKSIRFRQSPTVVTLSSLFARFVSYVRPKWPRETVRNNKRDRVTRVFIFYVRSVAVRRIFVVIVWRDGFSFPLFI